MNKEGKLEACSILAEEYATIAKSSGFSSEDVFTHYMERCMRREDEMVAEQVMREAYSLMRSDPNLSWVSEWNKEKKARQALEVKYNALTRDVGIAFKADKIQEERDKHLMNYARALNFL